ncbi:E3 ubiquitin ligase BIG BROTHER-related-like [Andrographis paniculata]|uniref:E3 ubiquitin ligase BIG BROTHER-related-like n=1 Tax=Andrographis paniculata TaxID=175694 RepID=UPI0021E98E55|nr:E3 ubiquitin ligase BIG BROTHER-related-like [Andrographis paniculata]
MDPSLLIVQTNQSSIESDAAVQREINNAQTPSNYTDRESTSLFLFEDLMNRRWESYDSDRVFRRILEEIDQQNYPAETILTTDVIDDITNLAIDQDIEYLRDGSNVDWTRVNVNALSLEIWGYVEHRVSHYMEYLLDEVALIGEHPRQNCNNDGLSDEIIDVYLKKRNITGAAPDEMCIVCRDDLREEVETKEIAGLECGHVYHLDCIKKWFRLNDTCPYCRAICGINKV